MAQRDSGYERKPGDLYETPEWVTEVILPEIASYWINIWEPAAGGRKMSKVLQSANKNVFSTDIADEKLPIDFLTGLSEIGGKFDAIITNPPYRLARKFVERALSHNVNMVAMLLDHNFDCGGTRKHLFGECPTFAKKIVLTKRIVWFERADGKKAAPSSNHAWYIWLRSHTGKPVIAYH